MTMSGSNYGFEAIVSPVYSFVGGPLDGTRQHVQLEINEGNLGPPVVYRVGQVPALGSGTGAHFKVHTYRLSTGGKYYYRYDGPDEDETADPVVARFYERMEALVYVGAVVLGSALVAGAWFLVNGG
jgi:hypothetical protein